MKRSWSPGSNPGDDMRMVLPLVCIEPFRLGHVEFDDSIGKSSSNDNELGLDEANLLKVGASRGLISLALGNSVVREMLP